MQKTWSLFAIAVLALSISFWTKGIEAQPQFGTNKSKPSGNISSVVTVNASISVQVTNEKIKTKESMLRFVVIDFLNSGPSVLKTPEGDQPLVKSIIDNKISTDNQNVQGIEAINAIIGVEVSKVLKSLVSGDKANQTGIVTIDTTSTCKPSAGNSVSCDNTVTIK